MFVSNKKKTHGGAIDTTLSYEPNSTSQYISPVRWFVETAVAGSSCCSWRRGSNL